MAELTMEAKDEIWAEAMSQFSLTENPISVSKQDLREAIDAIDMHFDKNTTAMDLAIPKLVRDDLSLQQKRILLSLILAKRAEDEVPIGE